MSDLARALQMLDGLDAEADRAIHDRNKPKGGQQVPFHGDFAGSSISSMHRLKWWTREIRVALGASHGRGTP